ncbi:MAG: PAS domain-containing protein, partial [Caldimicrobium sp.]|nr:PAS domain-containing protein [Caldimicrobium sp.]
MKNKANIFDLSKWRFGNQLLFVFFLIFLTTGVIVNYLNYSLQVNRFQNLIYHKVKLTRELLTSAILTPLLNEDFDKIERYLMNVVDTENQVVGVKLISPSGIILLSAIQSNGTTKIQYPRSPFELQLEERYIERESDWLYIFPVKVTPKSPPLAWISLSYSKELLAKIKRESLLTNIFTFLAALIVNFLIIGIFSKTFQKDLNLITNFLINLPERYGSFSRDVLHSQEMQTLESIANKLSAILKEQREKIYEEKNKLETILNVIKEGLVVVDRDLKIIHFNKAFLDLTESPPQGDLEGVRLPDILPLHEEDSNECLWKGKIIS